MLLINSKTCKCSIIYEKKSIFAGKGTGEYIFRFVNINNNEDFEELDLVLNGDKVVRPEFKGDKQPKPQIVEAAIKENKQGHEQIKDNRTASKRLTYHGDPLDLLLDIASIAIWISGFVALVVGLCIGKDVVMGVGIFIVVVLGIPFVERFSARKDFYKFS